MISNPIRWAPQFVSAQVEKAVAIIAAQPGTRRIWFFGSAANQRAKAGSDLDFAVEGLDSGVHFSVLGELMLELPSPVDLVRWEDANSPLRAEIIRQGTLVYAA